MNIFIMIAYKLAILFKNSLTSGFFFYLKKNLN